MAAQRLRRQSKRFVPPANSEGSHQDRLKSLTLSATSPAFGRPDGDFQKKFVEARLAPLAAGQTYVLRFSHEVTNAGVGELVIEELMLPTNDECVTALTELAFRVAGDTEITPPPVTELERPTGTLDAFTAAAAVA